MWLMSIIFILAGIFNLVAPDAAWYLSRGWQYKDAEPSDAALVVTRIGGVAIVIGIVLLFSY